MTTGTSICHLNPIKMSTLKSIYKTKIHTPVPNPTRNPPKINIHKGLGNTLAIAIG